MSDLEPLPKIRLGWGETPWDDLSRDELLREVQRMYSANISLVAVLRTLKGEESGGFWRVDRPGGTAIAKGERVRDAVKSRYDSESLYRSFYRYADDLLFPGLGFDWRVCDRCGRCYGNDVSMNAEPKSCAICKAIDGVESPLRALTWDDLSPRHGEDGDEDAEATTEPR